MTPLSLTRLLLPSVALAALACLLASGAHAQSSEGSVELLAFDVDTAGNSATSVGEIDVCSELAVDEERDIDVVVTGIPEAADSGGGLAGLQFTMLFDERYVEVVDYDIEGQLMGTAAGSNLVDFTDTVPSSSGLFRVAIADFGTNADESGSGVLVRITLRGVEAGTSNLVFVEDTLLQDTKPAVYEIDGMQNALIAVGVTCAPGATAPPVPSVIPTRSPDPADDPGETPDGDETPTDAASPGEDDTHRPSGESPGPGETDEPDIIDEEDSGSDVGIIIAAVVVALVVIGGGGAFVLLRRREKETP